ncbi:Kinase superfamily protein isoform 1 [Hibiscus syriacus]|uniref:Kinase superfamily protein isoform 1 n=1 Tax=Hibiscus syriacus TaxID=106335 RepID=A0A6A3AR56_HIBSY|nr:Kinase superfamily protein isoform 1 [Hibiscus syriacus]
MGFWTLFEVASMPILQMLLISLLGAFLASDYCNLLPEDTRRSLNRADRVRRVHPLAHVCQSPQDCHVPRHYFKVIYACKHWAHLFNGRHSWVDLGNLGNLLLIIVPAICNEDGSPFGDRNVCTAVGLSYSSFSMAPGGFYIWTISFQLMKASSLKPRALEAAEEWASKQANKNLDATPETHLLKGESEEQNVPQDSSPKPKGNASLWVKVAGFLHTILEDLMAPPTLGAILGFIFGTIVWVRNLIIGPGAPLREPTCDKVCDRQRSGRRLSLEWCVRFIILPIAGVCVVKAAGNLGFLPSNPLFHFVLMVQFTLPPAMNIGTMTHFFNVGQDECSVLFLCTYLASALALTSRSTVFMWILT